MDRKTLFTFSGLIILAVASRILPHPLNFAPIGGVALFSAAHFKNRIVGFLIPLFAMWLSDLFINNVTYGAYYDSFVWISPGFYWVYGSFVLIALLGSKLFSQITTGRVLAGSLLSSAVFFLVTNFGAWLGSSMYPQTFAGLLMSYAAGIPFVWNTIAGDLVYTGVLFGAAYWYRKSVPAVTA